MTGFLASLGMTKLGYWIPTGVYPEYHRGTGMTMWRVQILRGVYPVLDTGLRMTTHKCQLYVQAPCLTIGGLLCTIIYASPKEALLCGGKMLLFPDEMRNLNQIEILAPPLEPAMAARGHCVQDDDNDKTWKSEMWRLLPMWTMAKRR